MVVDVYKYEDYRAVIREHVEQAESSWGLWAKLAKAADCQPPYLSQVMKGKAHLTADHIIGLASYLHLSDDETDYMLLLLELSRAGTAKLRKYLKSKIEKIRASREDLTKRLAQPRLESGAKESLYYSAWYWSALHVIVSIPEFRTTKAIASRLMLPPDFVTYALEQLAQHGIVKRKGDSWELGTADIHIPKDSLMIGIHHSNWRQRAITDSTMPGRDNVHYTAVYSLSRSDYQHLKEKMLDLVEHSRKVVAPSKEEELVCFACDLFTV